MKKRFPAFIIAVLFLSVMIFSGGAQAEAEVTIQLGHVDPPNEFESSDQSFAVVFEDFVEAMSDGRIQVELYPADGLGSEREAMELTQMGAVESYLATDGGIGRFFPLIGIKDIPFSITDFEVAYEVWDGQFGEAISEKIEEDTGLKLLAVIEQGGFFHLSNDERPITSPEDMEGLTMRSMAIDSHINFFESLGAGATVIDWAEVYTALETGVADGQHNPINPFRNASFYEVQDYLTVTNHLYSTHWFLVNADWFYGLAEEDQEIIRKAARIANRASRGLNRVLEASDDYGFPFLEAQGVEIYYPTQDELDAFADVTVPAALEFIEEEWGEEGIYWAEKYLEAVEEAEEKVEARAGEKGSYWRQ